MNAPPLLVSFSSLGEFLGALSEDLRELSAAPITELAESRLPPVFNRRCLATLFGFSPKFVGAMYDKPERYYRKFTIRSGNKKRVIHAPKVGLKVFQKWFGYHLSRVIEFPESVVGFVPTRSAIEGAAAHCKADWIYSVDIKNFFGTTRDALVQAELMRIGYCHQAAELITKLCAHNGVLPQGSPASPVLSNLTFHNADHELNRLAGQHRLRLTRYADDIVLSGHGTFPEIVRKEVADIINRGGWTLSKRKEHLATAPQRLKVYGLLVNGARPRLSKGYRNRIRAYRHLLSNRLVVDKEELNKMQGHIAYARAVDEFVNLA